MGAEVCNEHIDWRAVVDALSERMVSQVVTARQVGRPRGFAAVEEREAKLLALRAASSTSRSRRAAEVTDAELDARWDKNAKLTRKGVGE